MAVESLAELARFVGHRNTVPKIAAANDPASPVPELTFDDELSWELGSKTVLLYAAKLSPTDDYSILHYPASRVVMTVDFAQPWSAPASRLAMARGGASTSSWRSTSRA